MKINLNWCVKKAEWQGSKRLLRKELWLNKRNKFIASAEKERQQEEKNVQMLSTVSEEKFQSIANPISAKIEIRMNYHRVIYIFSQMLGGSLLAVLRGEILLWQRYRWAPLITPSRGVEVNLLERLQFDNDALSYRLIITCVSAYRNPWEKFIAQLTNLFMGFIVSYGWLSLSHKFKSLREI